MKRFFIINILAAISFIAKSQSPEKIAYQAVIRNANNNLVANAFIKIKISITKGMPPAGTIVYSEQHNPLTNANGLVSLEIGSGNLLAGSFSSIRWEDGPYYITTETDPTNGNNYSIISTTQLLSVPYALYASKSSNGLPTGGIQGQVIALCDGKPTWTNGGVCPGLINSLNCSTLELQGYLTAGVLVNGVMASINYSGGNGLGYPGQIINSTGVTGLTASISAGSFANGNGAITYIIAGTPATIGNAVFALSIGGQNCNITLPVYDASLSKHTCGTQNIHNPTKNYENVKDKDGNDYKIVRIGSQIWMAENLKTTKYLNGDPVNNITLNSQWQNAVIGAYCSYENNLANDCPSGKLYNWFAVNDSRKICPAGWHIPTEEEWGVLSSFLGGDGIAGSKLKSTSQQLWENSSEFLPNNSSGFSGLPGGFRSDFGFYDNGFYGYWWTSSETDQDYAVSRGLFYDAPVFYKFDEKKTVGHSVRCMKD